MGIRQILKAIGLYGDTATAKALLAAAFAAMVAAAFFGFQFVRDLDIPAQITFVTATAVGALVIVSKVLQKISKIWDRFYGRYSPAVVPAWLRDSRPLLTAELQQRLNWLTSVVESERDLTSVIQVGKYTVDWKRFNDDLAYVKIVFPLTSLSVYRAVIALAEISGQIYWNHSPLGYTPVVAASSSNKGVVTLTKGRSVDLVITQRLGSDDVESIRKSVTPNASHIILDFQGLTIPVRLESITRPVVPWKTELNLGGNLFIPFRFELAYPNYSIDQQQSYISVRKNGDGQIFYIELALEQESAEQIHIGTELVRVSSPRFGEAEISKLSHLSNGDRNWLTGTADFAEPRVPQDLLSKVWWPSATIYTKFTDGHELRDTTRILYTPTRPDIDHPTE